MPEFLSFTSKSAAARRRIAAGLIVLCIPLMFACSSDGKPVKTVNKVEDPVTVRVKGVSNTEVLGNIEAYLKSLPVISKKKSRLYGREISDKITLGLHSFGYYNPKIDIEYPKRHSASHEIIATVDMGKPLFIRECRISVIGEGAFNQAFSDIIEKSGISSYRLLDHGKYEALKRALSEKAVSLGYFDAKMITSNILVYQEQNAADIRIVYDTGIRYKFGELRADEKTRQLLTPSTSLVNFVEGQNYSAATLSKFTSDLSKTNFYHAIDAQTLVEERKDGKVPVSLELERQARNQYRFGIGVATDEGIRGIVGWDKPLINMRGHSFSSYIRASKVKRTAQAIYKIPNRNPNLDFFYIKLAQTRIDHEDTLADTSHVSVHYVDADQGRWRRDYYIGSEYEDYTQSIEKGYPVSSMVGLTLSTRSSTGGIDPKMGYSIVWDNRAVELWKDSKIFYRTEFVFKAVSAVGENGRFIYRFQQGANVCPDSVAVPASMRFFAGGDQTLRGFSYNSVSTRNSIDELTGSKYMTSGTIEYEFPIGIANSRGAVFLDSAMLTNNYSRDHHIQWGPGIGYRYISPYGIAKVDIAYGIDNQRDKKQIKLHLQFGPEF